MFGKRLMSSVVLVILALVLLLTGGGVLALGMLILSLIAFRELTKACGVIAEGQKNNALEAVGYAGIVLYYLVVYGSKNPVYWVGMLALIFLGMMFVYVFSFPRFRAEQVMTAFFCAFYAPVLFTFIFLTRNLPNGIYMVWMIFISSWICDTCAYLTGMAVGKHKLAPVLSPKKSIEGAVGGIVGSALVGAAFGYFALERVFADQNVTWIAALICGVGAVISQVGDLAASGIKRNHDIKDYGKLIPGHGGIMDRFDSVLFTAPIIYYLAILLIHFE
ncbi:phosphatidate cytidylyltransferase [Eisenbergiella sp.]